MTGQSSTTRLFPILLVNFIGTLGFSIVLPFLAVLVAKLGGNALVYGSLGATYAAFQLVGAPVLGRWSDARGRRHVLLISQLGTLAAWLIFLVGLYLPNTTLLDLDSARLGTFVITIPLAVLYLARALDGLTGGNVSVANAYLADVTSEDERQKSFGRMAVAGNLGFIIGPVLGGLLGSTAAGEVPAVVAAALISCAALIVIARYLPESRLCALDRNPESNTVRKVFGQEQRDCYQLEGTADAGLRQILSLRCVPYLLGLNFLIFLAFNFFYTSFPMHATQGLGWSARGIGALFSFLGFVTVLTQGPLLGWLSHRFRAITLILVGGAILSSGFLLFRSPSTAVLFGGAALFAIGNGLLWPSFLSMLSTYAGDRYQGAVQGLSSSVGSLASIIGLLGGGLLYGVVGPAMFLVPALLILITVLLSLRFLPAAP